MVEFHSKANALDGESMKLLSDAIDHSEINHRGMVIHNDASHFSCGVNLERISDFIEVRDWDGLDAFLEHFQKTVKKMIVLKSDAIILKIKPRLLPSAD